MKTEVEVRRPINYEVLVAEIWSSRWKISAFMIAVAFTSVWFSLSLPNIYRSEVLLAPKSSESLSGLSMLGSQLGGLAGLAGLNIDGASNDRTAISIATIRSRKFVSEFVDRHNILVPLMASDRFDVETGELYIDDDDYDIAESKWTRKPDPPRGVIPTDEEAHEKFLEILNINTESDTGFIRISIDHQSPKLAQQWLQYLIDDANNFAMEHDVMEAKSTIAYLESRIVDTSQAALKEVLYRLMEEQTRVVMLASVTDEYVFSVLDPPAVPEEKIRPRRSAIVFLCGILGAVAAVFIFIIPGYVRRLRDL